VIRYLLAFGYGFAAVATILGLFIVASILGKWRARLSRERIECLADEPLEMTCERRTTIGTMHVTLGDMLERFERPTGELLEDGSPVMVPRARMVRVITLSGIPILRSSAEAKAMATTLEKFAEEQDDMAWHS
jgi:hypothetical protein